MEKQDSILTELELKYPQGQKLPDGSFLLGSRERAKIVLAARIDGKPGKFFPGKMLLCRPALQTTLELLPFLLLIFTMAATGWLLSAAAPVWKATGILTVGSLILICLVLCRKKEDGTASIEMLAELYASLTSGQKAETALWFYTGKTPDTGWIGNRFLLNFGQIGDGDYFLFLATDPAKEQYGEIIKTAFLQKGKKQIFLLGRNLADLEGIHHSCPVAATVAATRYSEHLKYYVNLNSCRKPINQEAENLEYLRKGTKRVIEQLTSVR